MNAFGGPLVVVLFSLLYVMFFIGFYLFYLRTYRVRKRFFWAIRGILQSQEDLTSQEKQLNLIYKKISESFSFVTSQTRGLTDWLEEFVYLFDTREPTVFKSSYGVEVDKALRDHAYSLLVHIRESNPFSSLPAKEANLLRTLKQAVESPNKELGLTTIRQLAEEIEVLDSAIRTGERRARISYTISIVGVILTVVFGIFSLMQVIFR